MAFLFACLLCKMISGAVEPKFYNKTFETQMSQELCQAVCHLDFDRVIALLYRGDDINFRDKYCSDSTPLHQAIMVESFRMAETLIARGADVNAADRGNNTPLHSSISYKNLELAKLLIDSGADVNFRCGTGSVDTPLQAAAWNNQLKHLLLLEQISI
ncbi:MAG: ankyrin repeat domain-containing protein [Microcoleus sp. PH2017_17_BER_D_A]|nr:ankyrin repeat domain-containing protein [Microcoleus sp. PH2017_17_BER_D_A]